jgi:siderophore synthetase component
MEDFMKNNASQSLSNDYLIDAINTYQQSINSSISSQANHYSLCALVNCYIREIIMPGNQLTVEPIFNEQYTKITFPVESYQVSFLADKISLTGFYNICSQVTAKDGQNELPLDYLSLFTVINHKLSNQYSIPLNLEIMLQAKNSLENISKFIKYNKASRSNAFIFNEQGLTFGHEFHPTPKARYGLNSKELLKISPEINAKFKLHYFKVPSNLLCQTFSARCTKLPELLIFKNGYVEYPIHPWQAKYILNQKSLCDILESLGITSMGEKGSEVIPTSSVRTLFNHTCDYFYKYSLHIRLTNCLRKNSYYELENAVKLSEIINEKNLTTNHPEVTILSEPKAYTINLPNQDDHLNLMFKELFGLILRENIAVKHQKSSYVALKLFSRNLKNGLTIQKIIYKLSQNHSKLHHLC